MINNKKIGCIIQARVGSNRFPKKILQILENNKTILDYVIFQLKASKTLEKIILATTNLNQDNIFQNIADNQKLEFCQGNENDVLDRYYNCAK